MGTKIIKGFSKFTKDQKIDFIMDQIHADQSTKNLISSFWHGDSSTQKVLDEFSENTITNFPLPFGVVPNFILNNEIHLVPMVIEESSVVAACANSAKFWGSRGGFSAEILGVKKVGQVHFTTSIGSDVVSRVFEQSKEIILNDVSPLIEKMEKRGGGILSLTLLDKTNDLDNYYQLFLEFNTCDAMGANFINSVLREFLKNLRSFLNLKQIQVTVLRLSCLY